MLADEGDVDVRSLAVGSKLASRSELHSLSCYAPHHTAELMSAGVCVYGCYLANDRSNCGMRTHTHVQVRRAQLENLGGDWREVCAGTFNVLITDISMNEKNVF